MSARKVRMAWRGYERRRQSIKTSSDFGTQKEEKGVHTNTGGQGQSFHRKGQLFHQNVRGQSFHRKGQLFHPVHERDAAATERGSSITYLMYTPRQHTLHKGREPE